MVGVVQDNLGGYSGLRRSFGTEWPTRVMVPVPLGEIAARDLHPDSVTGLKDVGCRAKVYPVLVDLLHGDRRRIGERLAVARPDDALLDVRRPSPGGTRHSFAVKSVSDDELEACRDTLTGPITVRSSSSWAEV